MRFTGLLLFLMVTSQAQADSFCFAQAQSYYEQLFCEVQAQGKGKSLPRFDEFKRNNQLTQALLLRRPAESVGVAVVLPQRPSPKSQKARPIAIQSAISSGGDISGCRLQQATISCGSSRYQLLGNRANQHINDGALEESNRLDLPVYGGDFSDRNALFSYLLKSYRHYVKKMIDIGLSGATMSYGTFEFLFGDLRDKGVNFNERFETMYGYLKRDKQSIRVDERIVVPAGLDIEGCGILDQRLIACVVEGRNYLFGSLPELLNKK